ncbi:MAG: hypothetical protein ACXWC3_29770, partial [Burkholderiales bacterium]
ITSRASGATGFAADRWRRHRRSTKHNREEPKQAQEVLGVRLAEGGRATGASLCARRKYRSGPAASARKGLALEPDATGL